MEVIERVNELIASYLGEKGIELVEVTYKRESGGMVLRLLVDTPEGITIDECEKLNDCLNELLDRENVIEEHYLLEVASPGLDRPIKTDRDFERVIGKEIEMSAYEAIDGKKQHTGKLIGMDSQKIVLQSDGISTIIPRDRIALARLKIGF